MEPMEIVIVEDNDEDAKNLLKFVRSNFSNTVRLIQDGAAAAEYILFRSGKGPLLILLDIVLPHIDGIELYNIIRSEPPEKNLSVIFMVASQQTKEYLEGIGVHPDGYLKKQKGAVLPSRL